MESIRFTLTIGQTSNLLNPTLCYLLASDNTLVQSCGLYDQPLSLQICCAGCMFLFVYALQHPTTLTEINSISENSTQSTHRLDHIGCNVAPKYSVYMKLTDSIMKHWLYFVAHVGSSELGKLLARLL